MPHKHRFQVIERGKLPSFIHATTKALLELDIYSEDCHRTCVETHMRKIRDTS